MAAAWWGSDHLKPGLPAWLQPMANSRSSARKKGQPTASSWGPSPHHHGPAQALPLVIQLHGISKEEEEGQQELQEGRGEEGGCCGRHVADKGDEGETLGG